MILISCSCETVFDDYINRGSEPNALIPLVGPGCGVLITRSNTSDVRNSCSYRYNQAETVYETFGLLRFTVKQQITQRLAREDLTRYSLRVFSGFPGLLFKITEAALNRQAPHDYIQYRMRAIWPLMRLIQPNRLNSVMR